MGETNLENLESILTEPARSFLAKANKFYGTDDFTIPEREGKQPSVGDYLKQLNILLENEESVFAFLEAMKNAPNNVIDIKKDDLFQYAHQIVKLANEKDKVLELLDVFKDVNTQVRQVVIPDYNFLGVADDIITLANEVELTKTALAKLNNPYGAFLTPNVGIIGKYTDKFITMAKNIDTVLEVMEIFSGRNIKDDSRILYQWVNEILAIGENKDMVEVYMRLTSGECNLPKLPAVQGIIEVAKDRNTMALLIDLNRYSVIDEGAGMDINAFETDFDVVKWMSNVPEDYKDLADNLKALAKDHHDGLVWLAKAASEYGTRLNLGYIAEDIDRGSAMAKNGKALYELAVKLKQYRTKDNQDTVKDEVTRLDKIQHMSDDKQTFEELVSQGIGYSKYFMPFVERLKFEGYSMNTHTLMDTFIAIKETYDELSNNKINIDDDEVMKNVAIQTVNYMLENRSGKKIYRARDISEAIKQVERKLAA